MSETLIMKFVAEILNPTNQARVQIKEVFEQVFFEKQYNHLKHKKRLA